MMLDWLGERNDDAAALAAALRIDAAVARVLVEKRSLTPDLGGTEGTDGVARAVIAALARADGHPETKR